MDSQRLIKFSVHVESLTLNHSTNYVPSLGFKFLNFPPIKIDLFDETRKNQKLLDLARLGVSVSDLSLNEVNAVTIEPSSEPPPAAAAHHKDTNNSAKRKLYNFKSGKSCLFIEKLSNLRENLNLYVLLENLLNQDCQYSENPSSTLSALSVTNLSNLVSLAVKNECEYNYSLKNLKIVDILDRSKIVGRLNFSVRLLVYDQVCSNLVIKSLDRDPQIIDRIIIKNDGKIPEKRAEFSTSWNKTPRSVSRSPSPVRSIRNTSPTQFRPRSGYSSPVGKQSLEVLPEEARQEETKLRHRSIGRDTPFSNRSYEYDLHKNHVSNSGLSARE